VDAAVELIAERGVRNFSLAEASRRLGVTVAAPYRHFADRDELLAAVAVRAFGTLGEALAVAGGEPPARRLASMAAGYVRFAASNRALFDVLFGSGIDKNRFPEVRRAAEPVDEAFTSCVALVCQDELGAAPALAGAVAATAHGYATLLLDGAFDGAFGGAFGGGSGGTSGGGSGGGSGGADDAGDLAAAHAARAILALVEGRSALRPS
jgi:AcrR family transcriptional regulator